MNNANIKKDFVAIVELLIANKGKKVDTILPQVIELATKKASGGSDIGKTFLKDDEGNTVAVYCYYHKRWELVSQCEYGKKANTATGLNTMCKEGTSAWTKQQRAANNAEKALLAKLTAGEQVDLVAAKAQIEEERQIITPREDGHGFATYEELMNAMN